MVLPMLTVESQIWLFSEVVSMPERSQRLHRVLVGLAIASLPVAVGIAFIEPSLRFRLMVPYIVLTTTTPCSRPCPPTANGLCSRSGAELHSGSL